MFFATPGNRPGITMPNPETSKVAKLTGFGLAQNFRPFFFWNPPKIGSPERLRDRLATTGVFQGAVVNVDYSDFSGVAKRVFGAPLTIIGNDFIELSSNSPFPVFSIITSMPVPFVELVNTLIIPISNILDVRKA